MDTPLPQIIPETDRSSLSSNIDAQLQTAWKRLSRDLFDRDGNSHRHAGQRIRQNPLLRQAIEEIKDGYFALLKQKVNLLRGYDNSASESERNKIYDMIGDSEYALIEHNENSLHRLMQENYGFDKEQANEILKETDRDPIQTDLKGLPKDVAAGIIGSIVRRSIDSFDMVLCRQELLSVPNDFGKLSLTNDTPSDRLSPPSGGASRSG